MVFVHQIVEEHRGEIALDSQVGKGTKVTIQFAPPLYRGPDQAFRRMSPRIRGWRADHPGGLGFPFNTLSRP